MMDRVIVSTGRCGSTLLSEMLAKHPDMMVMSEFFSVLDRNFVFQKGLVEGETFARFLEHPHAISNLIIPRQPWLEDNSSTRMTREIKDVLLTRSHVNSLQVLLNNVIDLKTAEGLYTDVRDAARKFPRAAMVDHYRRLFALLGERLGRCGGWIERSGVSIEYLDDLIDMFPQGKFVHIHRDGPATALSLRNHRWLALYASLHHAPFSDDEIRLLRNDTIDPATDPVIRRLTKDLPDLATFGDYWSWMLMRGYRAVPRLAPAQWLDIRYEDLVEKPRTVLEQIHAFFALPGDASWIAAAETMADKEQTADRRGAFTEAEMAALRDACRPGMILLNRADPDGYRETLRQLAESTNTLKM